MLSEAEIIKVKVKENYFEGDKVLEKEIEKPFKIESFTEEIQDKFSKYMQSVYLDLIKQNRSKLEDDYLEMLQKYFFDVSRGLYDFASNKFYEFINSKKEFINLLSFCIEKYQPINREDLGRWVDENEEEVSLLFERLFKTLNGDGKKKDGN